MRPWQFWMNTLVLSSQQNPPRFIELLMLLLAMVLLGIWQFLPDWPFLVLSLSYVVGAATSILVRETCLPSHQPRMTQITAVLLLIISIYGFTVLI
ncbi:MAG: hypothetical protein JOZ78_06050 [Chroococcidiopsidaceae cyanobacterium CP_BM_ER_R8_30]|nr:hypothetical protein [Chroococcidiopsidaceae cyanobacterium CP_BM_ER_R8_30]